MNAFCYCIACLMLFNVSFGKIMTIREEIRRKRESAKLGKLMKERFTLKGVSNPLISKLRQSSEHVTLSRDRRDATLLDDFEDQLNTLTNKIEERIVRSKHLHGHLLINSVLNFLLRYNSFTKDERVSHPQPDRQRNRPSSQLSEGATSMDPRDNGNRASDSLDDTMKELNSYTMDHLMDIFRNVSKPSPDGTKDPGINTICCSQG